MKSRAFTLVEILFVLAIIGILATIALSIMNSTRLKARDAHRKSDLQAVKVGMVLYKNTNGTYPKIARALCSSSAAAAPIYNPNWATLAIAMAPFVNTMPLDPLSQRNAAGNCPNVTEAWETQTNTGHGYTFFGNAVSGNGWSLWAALENKQDADRNGARAHSYASAGAAAASNGVYKSVYVYLAVEILAFGIPDANDTSDLVYGVGCRQVSGTCTEN